MTCSSTHDALARVALGSNRRFGPKTIGRGFSSVKALEIEARMKDLMPMASGDEVLRFSRLFTSDDSGRRSFS
jgi:hypothetical protein